MADAGKILEARDVADMGPEDRGVREKRIKGSENLDWGMRNRLSRLIKADGHCQFLPIDHGYFQAPDKGSGSFPGRFRTGVHAGTDRQPGAGG